MFMRQRDISSYILLGRSRSQRWPVLSLQLPEKNCRLTFRNCMFTFCRDVNTANADSVTRFSEISPLRQILKSVWSILEWLFSICQNCEPTLANILYFWAIFHRSKWPNFENNRAIWSHWMHTSPQHTIGKISKCKQFMSAQSHKCSMIMNYVSTTKRRVHTERNTP